MKLAAANIEIIRGFLARTPEMTAAILEKRNKRRLGTNTSRNYKATRDHSQPATARKPLAPLRM